MVAGILNQMIVAEAVLTQAQVLILGSPVDSWRRKEHRLSTLLSVLSEAPCPVLVVGSEPLDEKIEAVAIADDLTPWSKPAVTAAFYFAEAMDAPHVYHLHVNPLQRERFAQALRRYAMRQGTQVRPEAASEFLKDLEHDLSLQLRERAGEETVWFPEREGRYTASVLHGPVLDTIESAISKDQGWNAGLIVFGQHRSFHRRPFRAGNVPFSEMGRLGKLAAIVPPPRAHLVKWGGVFAPNSPLRRRVILKPGVKKAARHKQCAEIKAGKAGKDGEAGKDEKAAGERKGSSLSSSRGPCRRATGSRPAQL